MLATATLESQSANEEIAAIGTSHVIAGADLAGETRQQRTFVLGGTNHRWTRRGISCSDALVTVLRKDASTQNQFIPGVGYKNSSQHKLLSQRGIYIVSSWMLRCVWACSQTPYGAKSQR